MSGSTQNRYKKGIEQVPGKGYPGFVHYDEQILKIVHSRILHKQPWRIDKDLIQRLKGAVYCINQREGHKKPEEYQYEINTEIPSLGTIRFSFKMFFHNHSPFLRYSWY
jgi:hypothetical protein